MKQESHSTRFVAKARILFKTSWSGASETSLTISRKKPNAGSSSVRCWGAGSPVVIVVSVPGISQGAGAQVGSRSTRSPQAIVATVDPYHRAEVWGVSIKIIARKDRVAPAQARTL